MSQCFAAGVEPTALRIYLRGILAQNTCRCNGFVFFGVEEWNFLAGLPGYLAAYDFVGAYCCCMSVYGVEMGNCRLLKHIFVLYHTLL